MIPRSLRSIWVNHKPDFCDRPPSLRRVVSFIHAKHCSFPCCAVLKSDFNPVSERS
jgi:hypothetical protein